MVKSCLVLNGPLTDIFEQILINQKWLGRRHYSTLAGLLQTDEHIIRASAIYFEWVIPGHTTDNTGW